MNADMMLGGVLGFVLGLILFGVAAANSIEANWRDAMSRGYAEYCPKDGRFAWKGECQ